MLDEDRLLRKMELIERLFLGASTDGEKVAAMAAKERIKERLKEFQKLDLPIEFSFKMSDPWNRALFTALLRRYDIKPYRYPRQRATTIMAKIPRKFVNEILWPEFKELSKTLTDFLTEATQRMIREAIFKDDSDAEVIAEPLGLGTSQSEIAFN